MIGGSGREGVSVIYALFLVSVIALLGVAAVSVMAPGHEASVDVLDSTADFYAAQSGLEWFERKTAGYTTADRDKFMSLDGAFMHLPAGRRFTLRVEYSDPDDDRATEDLVTVTSTGSLGPPSAAGNRRIVRMSSPVPAVRSGAELFSDHFDQPDTLFFNATYVFGDTASAHSDMIPYISVLDAESGDLLSEFTHSSEPGGKQSVMMMGGGREARLTAPAGLCFRWRSSGSDASCGDQECSSSAECQARKGFDPPVDDEGFANYFIKVRARVLSGNGFGVYFRASYSGSGGTVDFGSLTAYIWQYDAGMGYLAPCDMMTAVAGSDGSGMLFTRRISGGSETCGSGCGLFMDHNPASALLPFPFFCPENRTGMETLNGWRWREFNWRSGWRTVYIYVYKNRANIYLGREEASGFGSEGDPEHIGEVYLDSVGDLLKTGDVGLRTFENSVIEVDYIKIYQNDADHDPSTLAGSS